MTKAVTLGPAWPTRFPQAWASDWGEDGKGLWMAFTFDSVRYAFRWIKPARFQMGSPEHEPERSADETQHEVTLTRGFWLGETTVTQALWQAVTGVNPSRFKGEDLPVERVSWQDTQGFMATLNGQQPNLKLCLPSEAQWEYACRAGSQGRFHFGETITTEQVNYDGNHPPQGSAKGAYRQKTMAVRALPANEWVLYQMQGNVREWCADWYGKYPADHQVDPSGPDSGRGRVLRGGSWFVSGWYCRAAYRCWYVPGSRDNDAGFRLARGH